MYARPVRNGMHHPGVAVTTGFGAVACGLRDLAAGTVTQSASNSPSASPASLCSCQRLACCSGGGVYVERPDGMLRFRWVKAPSSAELARLTQTLAQRIGRYLERQGLLERDA